MKKIMKKITLCLLIVLMNMICFNAYSVELFLTDDDIQFEINLDVSQGLYGNWEKQNIWFLYPGVEIELYGKMDAVKIETSFDSEGLYTGKYNEILKKAALSLKLSDELRLTLGQFKSPFGTEIQRGRSKRAYLSHSLSSKKMAPSYKRGVSLEIENIFSLLDFEAGLFSGGKISDEDSTLKKLLAAGSCGLKLELTDTLDLNIRYSAFLSSAVQQALYYEFGQALALKLDFNFGKKNDLVVFLEYMEFLDDSFTFNHHSLWSHGLFASFEYRVDLWEPYLAAEHYKALLSAFSQDDVLKISPGCNAYLKDNIRLQLQYDFFFYYINWVMNHEVNFFLYFDI